VLGVIIRSFEAIDEQILGRIQEIRVRVCKRGERRRGEEGENERNGGIRVFSLFIHALGRVDPRPGPFPLFTGRLIQILMDLDQSNAPGALV